MSESEAGSAGIPPDWYPDPAGSTSLRWWDGARWTTQLRPVAVVPAVPDERPYVPFQSPTSAPPRALRGIAYTRSVWWISFQPLWGLATQVVLYTVVTAFGPVAPWSLVLGFAALNLALWSLLIRFAFADRGALLVGGNGSAASAWWMLLSPLAYLAARAQHVRLWEESGAWAPLIWWVLALVVAPGLAVLGIFAAYGIFAP